MSTSASPAANSAGISTSDASTHSAGRWVQRSCQYFQASFLEEVRRFLPIPVAVVRIGG